MQPAVNIEPFVVGGVPVRLEGEDVRALQALRTFWDELFIETAEKSARAGVRFELRREPFSVPLGDEVYATRDLSVHRTPDSFYLSCGASSLQVWPEAGKASCFLSGSFHEHAFYARREFFLLAWLMLLRPHGLYGLHACGLRRGETGLLLIGPSGVGKTTTTLNLMRSGWACLSDDAVLLRRNGGETEALALRRGFSCTHDTLRALGGGDALKQGSPKEHISGAAHGTFVEQCQPTLLVFPGRGHAKTDLQERSSVESLVALCQNSAGIMTDRVVSQRQIALLKDLASRARSFELHLGPDALETPGLVSGLLSEVE